MNSLYTPIVADWRAVRPGDVIRLGTAAIERMAPYRDPADFYRVLIRNAEHRLHRANLAVPTAGLTVLRAHHILAMVTGGIAPDVEQAFWDGLGTNAELWDLEMADHQFISKYAALVKAWEAFEVAQDVRSEYWCDDQPEEHDHGYLR